MKLAWNRPEVTIVAVNDLGSLESLAYLLRHDTVYRNWEHEVVIDGTDLVIDGKKELSLFRKKTPLNFHGKI